MWFFCTLIPTSAVAIALLYSTFLGFGCAWVDTEINLRGEDNIAEDKI